MQKRDGVRIQSGQSQVTSDLSSYSDKQREMDEQAKSSASSTASSSVSRLFAHVDGGSPNNNKSVRRSKDEYGGDETARSNNSSPVKQRQRIEDEIIKIREVIIENVISSSQKGGNLRSTQESQLSSKSGPPDTVVKIIPSPRLPSADILRPSVSIRPSIAAVVTRSLFMYMCFECALLNSCMHVYLFILFLYTSYFLIILTRTLIILTLNSLMKTDSNSTGQH